MTTRGNGTLTSVIIALFLFCLPISMAAANSGWAILNIGVVILLWQQRNENWLGRQGLHWRVFFGHPLQIAVTVFIATQIVSWLFSDVCQHRLKALSELQHPLSFLLVSGLCRGRPDFSRHVEGKLHWLAGATAIVAAYCVAQFFTGIDWAHGFQAVLKTPRLVGANYRTSGFFGHPLTLAYLSLVCLPILGMFAFNPKPLKNSFWPYGLGFIGCLIALLSAQSRTVWVVAIIVIAMLFAIRSLKVMLGVMAVLIVVLGLFYASNAGFRDRLLQMNPRTANPVEFMRLQFWRVHWQIYQRQPLLGVGTNCSTYILKDAYARAGLQGYGRKFAAHNQYLQLLADSGIIGFLSFMSIFIVMIWQFLSRAFLKTMLKPAQKAHAPPVTSPKSAVDQDVYASRLWHRRIRRYGYESPGHVAAFLMVLGFLIGCLTQNAAKDSVVAIALWMFLAFFTVIEREPNDA